MITFKKIRWKNFLSTGNTPIEVNLDQSHTTLVIGKNGSGKSTLLDALCFGLFNKPFRMIKKEQMVNTINNGESEIEIWFDVGTKSYRILRGIKPNRFEIYCDDEMINQNATTMDYQKYLEKNIMKLNYRSFIQVVILGSSSYEPFMKMKPRYRREVVEEILDIRVFGLMDLLLRSQQSDLQKKITEVRHHADLINTKYETEAKHLKSLQNEDTTTKTHKLSQLEKIDKDSSNYSSNIQKLNEEIAVTQSKIVDKEKIDNKVSKLTKLETKIEQNINNHKKTLDFFLKNDTCPTCTQKIEPNFKTQKCGHEAAAIQKLELGLLELQKELDTSYTKVTEFNTLSDKIGQMNVEVAKINTSLEGLKRHSDSIDEEIKMLGDKTSDREKVQQQLDELKVKLGEAQVDLDKVLEEKSYVDVCREILNDKGAKAKIIQKYLPIMNTLVNQYLQSMDFFISFHLDEEFNETIKSRHRDSFNYNNFSEGEKMRIDLALLFTWRHIAKMKNSTNTNLLVLDEVFDSSLDGQGTDDFFKIIGKLSKENIFIISHKGDILFDKFTNIIKFEKTNNFTKLETV
tara:strand:- start:1876 stop:3591 length:1716 start_codon:yes stop_codon:yes gene_type:complete